MLELIDSPPIAVSPVPPGARRSRSAPKVLVTGGSGFLGQYLVAALVGRSQFVRILDQAAPSLLPAGVEYMRGSVLDRTAVQRALDGISWRLSLGRHGASVGCRSSRF